MKHHVETNHHARKQPIVVLTNVATGYAARRGQARIVTEGIDVSLRAGELTCLLGPNGAGKSTLMRTIAGMQPPLAGAVLIDGRDIRQMSTRELARVVSVVLTDRTATGMLSAYALVALGRHPHTNWLGRLTEADHAAVREAMAITGAVEFAERLVTELSDGERQRVMVARALAQEPRTMVLDEITAFLDLPRRVEIMGMLRQLAHETGRAMLLSTHDLDLALRASDRIWLLPKNGQLTVGAPEDLVLSGAFEAAFAAEGVQFQPELGSFRIRSTQRGHLHVHGSGLARLWTVRALERAGYAVVDDPVSALMRVRVQTATGSPVEGGRASWLIESGEEVRCDSIEQMLEALAAASGAPAPASPTVMHR
jgi:iron complex transport system ATP-binding protein